MTQTIDPAVHDRRGGRPPVFGNFIGGAWRAGHDEQLFTSVNPADTRDVIGLFPASTAADMAEAIRAAEVAFPAWRRTPAPKRGEILYRFGALLTEHKERLARAMTREMGKVLDEARGDVQEGIDIAYLMAGEGRRLFGDTVPSELPDKWAMSVREPIGVAGIITPWNFPMAIPCWKTMPALVAGNTVVIKPASDTPHCAILLVELMAEAGFPAGTVNLVTGSGEAAGMALVNSPDVPVISFTGSGDTGRTIAVAAGRRLKRLSLELGGKNGIVVMDDADLDLAVDGIVWSAFGTTGQRCTAASRLIVHEAVADDLVSRLATRVSALRLGDGLDPQTQVGPLINAAALDRVTRYAERGRRTTGWCAAEGSRPTGRAWSTATSSSPRSSTACGRWTGWRRRRSSARCCRSSASTATRRRSSPSTRRATASHRASSPATTGRRSARCATSRPASCTSTPARSAPRRTCRSAA